MIRMCLSEVRNFIFNIEEKAVMLDLLVVTGFGSRGLFHLQITQASPDLGWGEIWSWFSLSAIFVTSYIFLILNPGTLIKCYSKDLYAFVHSNQRCLRDVFLASVCFISFLHLPQFEK